MKKYIAIMLSMILTAFLSGCAKEEEKPMEEAIAWAIS